MKKSSLIMVCLLLLIVSACGKNNVKESEKNSAATDKLQKVSLMLDWYPNAVHSFLFVAEEKGYFKEQGLDVDIQMPADTNDPLKLATTGTCGP
jgi:putative hydroxymethylpyrimidine transport system substrate-binding protein